MEKCTFNSELTNVDEMFSLSDQLTVYSRVSLEWDSVNPNAYKHSECYTQSKRRDSSRKHCGRPERDTIREAPWNTLARLLHPHSNGNAVWNDDPSRAIARDEGGLQYVKLLSRLIDE